MKTGKRNPGGQLLGSFSPEGNKYLRLMNQLIQLVCATCICCRGTGLPRNVLLGQLHPRAPFCGNFFCDCMCCEVGSVSGVIIVSVKSPRSNKKHQVNRFNADTDRFSDNLPL